MRLSKLKKRLTALSVRTGCEVYLKALPDGDFLIGAAHPTETKNGHHRTVALSEREDPNGDLVRGDYGYGYRYATYLESGDIWAEQARRSVTLTLEAAERAVTDLERSVSSDQVRAALFGEV